MQAAFPSAENSSACTGDSKLTSESERPREEGGDSSGFEDCDDAWLTPYPDANPTGALVEAEVPMNGVRRKRKRDGQIVERSPVWYSVYKKSRRALKKAGTYYVGSAEDRTTFDTKKHLLNWVQVRQYQCRYLTHLLRDHGRIPTEVAESCMYEIEAVLDWILEHSWWVNDYDMGNAWLWVAMEAQQHTSLLLEKPFVFDDNDTIQRWSLQSLNEDMRRAPHPSGLFASTEQRMAVEAEDYSKRTLEEHAKAARHFDLLLRDAAPPMQYNAVRTVANERAKEAELDAPPWLYERVVQAKKALRKEKGMFGETVLIEVK